MQSRKSFFNKTVFFKNIKQFCPIWIAYLIALLICGPMQIINTVASVTPRNGYLEKAIPGIRIENITYALTDTSVETLVFIAALAAAVFVFSYIHIQKSSNMIHALPLGRTELFFSNYLSGLAMMIVPLLLSAALMTAVCAANQYPYMFLVGFWLLKAAVAAFLFYSMAVLTAMVTGVVFAVPFYYLIINYLVVGFQFILTTLVMSLCYGMSGSLDRYNVNSIWSPLPYLQSNVNVEMEWKNGSLGSVSVSGMWILAVYGIAAVLLTICALLIYRKRKMENVGKLISVGWIQPIFRWGMAVGVSFLSCLFICAKIQSSTGPKTQFWTCVGALLVIGAVVFILVEICLKKKLKVLNRKKILELGAYLIIVIAAAMLLETDTFGIERKVPDTSQIQYVTLYGNYQIYADEPEMIEKVCSLHQTVIDKKDEFEDFYTDGDGNTFGLSITYKLKDGTSVNRSYAIPMKDNRVTDSGNVASQLLDLFGDEEKFMETTYCMNYDEITYTEGSIDLYKEGEEMMESTNEWISAEDSEKITEAYLKDLREGNLDSYLLSGYGSEQDEMVYFNNISLNFTCKDGIKDIYYYMNPEDYADNYSFSKSGSAYLTFTTECTNTLAVLKELGLMDNTEGYKLMTCKEYNEYYEQTNEYDYSEYGYTDAAMESTYANNAVAR